MVQSVYSRALDSLEVNPQRCGLAPKNGKVSHEIRHLLFGRRPNVYRAVFTIVGDTVRVLRIVRGSRRWLTRRQIQEAGDAGQETDDFVQDGQ